MYWRGSSCVGKKKCEQNIAEDTFLGVNLENPNIQSFAVATGKYSVTFRNILLATTSGL